jgi:excisionase family DNA binding protein
MSSSKWGGLAESCRLGAMPLPPETPELMTTAEVAAVIRRCDETVRSFVKDGALDGAMVGAKFLITRKSVERLLERVTSPERAKRDDMAAPPARTTSAASSPYRSRRRG